MSYPENGRINNMSDYSPLIAYIHSNTLRWSYGSIKGRRDDSWEKTISNQDLPTLTKSLALAGFSGIYVDSYGYRKPDTIINQLSLILNTNPMVSDNKRYYFFSTGEYNKRLRIDMSDADWDKEVNYIF